MLERGLGSPEQGFMSTKLVVLTVIGAASVAAAAAGGYVALRMNSSEATAVKSQIPEPAVADSSAAAVEPAPVTAKPASLPVNQPTERRSVQTAGRPARAESKPTSRPTSKSTAPARPNLPSEVNTTTAPLLAQPLVAPASDPLVTDAKDPKIEPVAAASPEPPSPMFEELTVNRDSVIGIRLDTRVSSATAHVEDKVTARVARDVTVAGHTAIPSGARLEGVVTVVERAGKFKDRAHIGIQFQSLLLPDGSRVPIQTEAILRDGEPPAGPSKVGASAVVGGILGAVLGGKKGAIIGSSVGAAGGTAAVVAGGANDVVIQEGTPLTVRLTSPVTVTIDKTQQN